MGEAILLVEVTLSSIPPPSVSPRCLTCLSFPMSSLILQLPCDGVCMEEWALGGRGHALSIIKDVVSRAANEFSRASHVTVGWMGEGER